MGTYLCKSLIFVWSNVNEIELILNSHSALNFGEVSKFGDSLNLENCHQTYTENFDEIK